MAVSRSSCSFICEWLVLAGWTASDLTSAMLIRRENSSSLSEALASSRVGLGQGREPAGCGPVEVPGVHDDPAYGGPVAAYVLAGGRRTAGQRQSRDAVLRRRNALFKYVKARGSALEHIELV